MLPPSYLIQTNRHQSTDAYLRWFAWTVAFPPRPLAPTLSSVATACQIQRFVMDGLFWTEPHFIAVAEPREPWVMALRQRVEEALKGAIVPLKVLVL